MRATIQDRVLSLFCRVVGLFHGVLSRLYRVSGLFYRIFAYVRRDQSRPDRMEPLVAVVREHVL